MTFVKAAWHFNITMTSLIDMPPACSRHAAARFLSFPWAGTSMRVLSHMGKINGNPDLLCKKCISMPVGIYFFLSCKCRKAL